MGRLVKFDGDGGLTPIRKDEEQIVEYRMGFLVLWVLLFIVVLVLAWRFYQLQIIKGDFYSDKSEKNFTQLRRVPAIRGIVFDRNRRPVVDNRASFELQITPAFTKKPLETMDALQSILKLDPDDARRVREAITRARGLDRFQPIRISGDLDQERMALFEFHRMELDGVDVVPVPHRYFRYGAMASHLLGYLNEIDPDTLARLNKDGKGYRQGDYIGRKGVELAYEDDMRGVDGAEQVYVDAKGRLVDEKDVKIENFVPEKKTARPGNNLILSMDLELQQAAEEAFDRPEGGVIVLDAKTGAILALVSRPSFDPNEMTGRISRDRWKELVADPLKPLMNKVTQDHNHPGSTFKIVGALAGLETGEINESSRNSCSGSYRLGARPFRCWKAHGHGSINLHTSLVQSCDVFYYHLGDRLGLDNLARYARILGFGAKTGVDIREESPGVIPDVAFYNRPRFGGYQKGYAVNSSIGQGDVNVTLMQLALAYTAIANGGKLFKPQSVLRVEAPDGSIVREVKASIRSELKVAPEHLKAVKDALVGVVEEPGGTAHSKLLPELKGIGIGGKTGTAQVVAIGNVRLKKEQMEYFERDHAWFVSFAPAKDPEIVVAVLNKHGGHGGSDAAPIAMKVIKAYFEKVKGLSLPIGAIRVAPKEEESEQEDTILLPGQAEGVSPEPDAEENQDAADEAEPEKKTE